MAADSLTASYVIDGKTDIMAAAVTTMNNGTDAIQKSKASATVYPTFNFTHKLTLVNIKAYTPTAKEQEAWGKITKIELVGVMATSGSNLTNGVNNVCTVTLKDAAAAVSGAAANVVVPFYHCALNSDATPKLVYDDLKISNQDDKDADTDGVLYGPVEIPAPAAGATTDYTSTDAKYVAYSMIAPFTTKDVTLPKANLKLIVYTEENTDGIEAKIENLYSDNTFATVFEGPTEGKKFDVTLKFVGKEITASATVTDWEPVYAGEVEII